MQSDCGGQSQGSWLPQSCPCSVGAIVMSGPFWKNLGLVLQVLLWGRENTSLEKQHLCDGLSQRAGRAGQDGEFGSLQCNLKSAKTQTSVLCLWSWQGIAQGREQSSSCLLGGWDPQISLGLVSSSCSQVGHETWLSLPLLTGAGMAG